MQPAHLNRYLYPLPPQPQLTSCSRLIFNEVGDLISGASDPFSDGFGRSDASSSACPTLLELLEVATGGG